MHKISFAECSNGKRCLVCCRMLTRGFKCTTHLKASTSDLPLDCRYCYKRFKHKFYLTRDELIHTADRPYKCGDCDKSFK